MQPAFFCPMVKCKYHVAESHQTKFFKNFKQLKQHYVKVHATKEFCCKTCNQGSVPDCDPVRCILYRTA